MRDLNHKRQLIQSIYELQLSEHFVMALEDAQQAQQIISLLNSLQQHAEQWQ
ncbi:hypothetical protein [Acinetobacter ihumii]|uniref:hypothetical protein n=1 Tax=Acinetobacter ihumii TaxID=2483802 RepID=UPI0013EF1B93|nr:hypothetical protein [Acinetobacter ihumii]